MRPFISYYGGKWRIALYYPVPRWNMIVEPFAGSAGYSVRYFGRDVRLYDLDERVIATWRYLIGSSERDIRALPLLGPHDHVSDLNISQEARWLIGWWLNKGMTAPCLRPSRWMREPLPGRDATYWGEGVRERLASQVSGIRHWRAEVSSYIDVPDVEATWFIDPPYVGAPGARYAKGNSGIDYEALASWCRSRGGQVIVCENVGADWLPFRPFMIAKATAGHGRKRISQEAVWEGEIL